MRDHLADERLVADLLQARDAARLTPSPSQRGMEFDLDRGYQVGNTLHERLSNRGYQAVGRKIGFTNPAMWEQFDVKQPIWAHMYSETVHFAPEGYLRLPIDGLVAPRLEPEVVLKLRDAVPDGDPSIEQIARCIEWAAIGFEIVDSHYPDWRFTASEAVADFGVHAALVVGPPCARESGGSPTRRHEPPDARSHAPRRQGLRGRWGRSQRPGQSSTCAGPSDASAGGPIMGPAADAWRGDHHRHAHGSALPTAR